MENADKNDVQEVILNDIESCVKALYKDKEKEVARDELNLSINAALDIGVPEEQILTKFISSLPEASRNGLIRELAKVLSLSESDIQYLECAGH